MEDKRIPHTNQDQINYVNRMVAARSGAWNLGIPGRDRPREQRELGAILRTLNENAD